MLTSRPLDYLSVQLQRTTLISEYNQWTSRMNRATLESNSGPELSTSIPNNRVRRLRNFVPQDLELRNRDSSVV
jgi:hypothetical protein